MRTVYVVLLAAMGCAACQRADLVQPSPATTTQLAAPQPPNEQAAHADRLARRFGLSPLSATSEPELRIWSTEYVFGNIDAVIVRKDSVTAYFLPSESDPSEPRVASRPTTGQPPVFGIMPDLEKLDGVFWSCPVIDGAGVLFDGVSEGRRFSFAADNPGNCDDPRREWIRKAYELIGPTPKPASKPEH